MQGRIRAACGRARSRPTAATVSMATRPGSPTRRSPTCSRSEEHTSELQSLMRISYAVFCLKKKKTKNTKTKNKQETTRTLHNTKAILHYDTTNRNTTKKIQ